MDRDLPALQLLQGRWLSCGPSGLDEPTEHVISGWGVACPQTGGEARLELSPRGHLQLLGCRLIHNDPGRLEWADGDLWLRRQPTPPAVPPPLSPLSVWPFGTDPGGPGMRRPERRETVYPVVVDLPSRHSSPVSSRPPSPRFPWPFGGDPGGMGVRRPDRIGSSPVSHPSADPYPVTFRPVPAPATRPATPPQLLHSTPPRVRTPPSPPSPLSPHRSPIRNPSPATPPHRPLWRSHISPPPPIRPSSPATPPRHRLAAPTRHPSPQPHSSPTSTPCAHPRQDPHHLCHSSHCLDHRRWLEAAYREHFHNLSQLPPTAPSAVPLPSSPRLDRSSPALAPRHSPSLSP
eukprot:Sspe_Gene.19677::Locus_7185_Transcript_1_1_Confidence_1.000_Length_1113::g.19677::m.19677